MTNRIAITLALLVALAVGLDLALGLGGTLFVARRFVAILDWLAFWR